MTNNTPEFWEINGVSLHQYGWSVTTVGGTRYDLPPRRGSNIAMPFRPGQVLTPKPPDARPMTLVMFLVGMDPATGVSTGDQILRFNDSWDFLRRLLWTVGAAPVTLTKRTRLTVGGVETLLLADGIAEVTGTMEPTMTGRTRADFSIDLLMGDPYFYGRAPISLQMNRNQSKSVVNPGHDVAAWSHLGVTMTGPLFKPVLSNLTTHPYVSLEYDGTIPAGQSVTFDVGAFTAVRSDGANVIGNVVHSGARNFMVLVPGTNLLQLTDANPDTGVIGTDGSATVTFNPPYI